MSAYAVLPLEPWQEERLELAYAVDGRRKIKVTALSTPAAHRLRRCEKLPQTTLGAWSPVYLSIRTSGQCAWWWWWWLAMHRMCTLVGFTASRTLHTQFKAGPTRASLI